MIGARRKPYLLCRGLRARGYTGYSLNASNPAFPSDDDYYYTLRLAMDKVMASAVDCDAPKLGTCFDEVSSRGNITLQVSWGAACSRQPAVSIWVARVQRTEKGS